MGLQRVKDAVDGLVTLVANNAQREEQEKPTLDVHLNCIFLGNPGTGASDHSDLI